MGFFTKKTPSAPPADRTPTPPRSDAPPDGPIEGSVELDTAVESAADMVRALGAASFDTDDLAASAMAQQCEAWAQHLLVHSAPPDGPPPAKDAKPKRQWRALVRFVGQRRKAEQRFVQQSQTTLREAVWTFVRTLSRVMSDDRGADANMASQLSRLRDAAVSNSPDDLRREVSFAVEAIETVMKERQQKAAAHATELAQKVHTLAAELEQARREGAVDPLSRVPNRRSFDEHIERVSDLANVVGTPATLLMIDVDHFKSINDSFGHQAGDSAIRNVADAISRICKRRGDLVARYGGEEFAVVLGDTPLADAVVLAGRVQTAIRALRVGEGSAARGITASIGVALAGQGETPAEWIARADAALYAAKAAGRDRVEVR